MRLRLEHADDVVEIDTVGARLDLLVLGGVRISAAAPPSPFRESEYWGAILSPWPNRMRDGLLAFRDQTFALTVNEPHRRTALHGTVDREPFDVQQQTATSVRLATEAGITQPGWPSALRTTVEYALSDDVFTSSVTAHNIGQQPCPVGLGVHPYFDPGGSLDATVLDVPARTEILTDERLLPVGVAPRPTRAMALSGMDLDTTYGDLERREDGRAVALFQRADGHRVEIWGGEEALWFQVCTSDALPSPRARGAIAIEPVTCAPDGLNSPDARVLEPGESVTLMWGVRLLGHSHETD